MDSADEDGGLMNERRIALSRGRGGEGGHWLTEERVAMGGGGGQVREDCWNVTLTRRLGQQIGMMFVLRGWNVSAQLQNWFPASNSFDFTFTGPCFWRPAEVLLSEIWSRLLFPLIRRFLCWLFVLFEDRFIIVISYLIVSVTSWDVNHKYVQKI